MDSFGCKKRWYALNYLFQSMKWFWYSLIGFALIMCSCKSKKVVTDYHEKTIVNSELSAYHNVATIDTTRLLHIEDLKQIITIEEDVIVTEYDEKGNISKETKTKRKVVQDTEKATTEEERKGVESYSEDSLNHIADVSKMVDTSVEEESTGGQESFGKWFGIVIGLGIVLGVIVLIVYLRKKSKRISKLFDVD